MTRCTRPLSAALLLLSATSAMAHSGHGESGLAAGLMHPVLGLDHLLAMAAIGFWSVRQGAFMKNATPAFALGGMVLGAGLAWSGLGLPGVETGIALSVLVAGLLIATLARLPALAGGMLVAGFMVFHGYAHGAEVPAGATLAAYMAGFVTTTLTITLLGRGLGAWMLRADSRITQALGGALAIAAGLMAGA